MVTKAQGDILAKIINATGMAEVVRITEGKRQIALLYRVRDKGAWVAMVEYLLKHKTCWEAHVCQQYFLRGDSIVYGWNFILEAEEMEKAVKEISDLTARGMTEIPKQLVRRGGLNSFPLMGASTRRTAPIAFNPGAPGPTRGGPSQKGAHNIR